jgi:hypothetical protein
VIPQWHNTVFSRFKPIATILPVFIFVQRARFMNMRRYRRRECRGNVGREKGAASLRGYQRVVEDFANDAAPASNT